MVGIVDPSTVQDSVILKVSPQVQVSPTLKVTVNIYAATTIRINPQPNRPRQHQAPPALSGLRGTFSLHAVCHAVFPHGIADMETICPP